jgi:hypothetical protein
MRDEISSSEATWQVDELSAATLPDKRLTRRLRRLLDQLSAAPGKPIPAACGDWAAAKAAYRFFDNPRVTEHGVLAGHFAATAARVAVSEGQILILQDTTEFIYIRAQPGKIGFTKTVNAGRNTAGQPPRWPLTCPSADALHDRVGWPRHRSTRSGARDRVGSGVVNLFLVHRHARAAD